MLVELENLHFLTNIHPLINEAYKVRRCSKMLEDPDSFQYSSVMGF